ncbi:putative glycolipid-binding domain-containing protein [Streptomyces sp. So13.3]|uniref:putative glycolipid-binding domain-containing protein n=1 Tax=unclassified Streptomyces TaxID=2593676 RepID=UPI0011075B90|nr:MULTISPECIES: putative glycolipid-binding domain-containing protein [unclassified Streptomyces]MCZ4097945.1 putative glycolipid-binding domain-containing protein [Streptomyces sp. H39-C1]QNA71690.1 putative glycolipid-binding domain-containing protein [Streptomyces sp. So13.3]
MTTSHVLTWAVSESDGYETAWIEVDDTSLRARGRVVGTVPEPYWITYELDTTEDFVTRRLRATSEMASRTVELDLRGTQDGRWTVNGEPAPDLGSALDCDLGLSPLTNTMPVLRHALHRVPGEQDFLMAWIRVPDLTVQPNRQTYTHLGANRVRYASGTYRADLTLDADGLVVTYPGLAQRR